jgi:hypothetical protein
VQPREVEGDARLGRTTMPSGSVTAIGRPASSTRAMRRRPRSSTRRKVTGTPSPRVSDTHSGRTPSSMLPVVAV